VNRAVEFSESILQNRVVSSVGCNADDDDDGWFRGWFINPIAVTYWWLVVVAVVPALLATILVFLDQQITAVIVNRSEHKLKVQTAQQIRLFVAVAYSGDPIESQK